MHFSPTILSVLSFTLCLASPAPSFEPHNLSSYHVVEKNITLASRAADATWAVTQWAGANCVGEVVLTVSGTGVGECFTWADGGVVSFEFFGSGQLLVNFDGQSCGGNEVGEFEPNLPCLSILPGATEAGSFFIS